MEVVFRTVVQVVFQLQELTLVGLNNIWIDDNYFNARSMDVYITKLRKHLKDDEQIEIINIHGKGYKLITPEEE